MNETLVTVIGNVATEVTYTETAGGVPVANFRLASTERRYDRSRDGWVDGETQWVTVTAWRALAGHLIGSLSKGDPVVVSGRLRVREWADGEAKRSRVEIDARSVGHDLSRGTARFTWAPGARSASAGGSAGSGGVAVAAAGPAVGGEVDGKVGVTVGEAVPGWIVDALRVRRAAAGGVEEGAEEEPAEQSGEAGEVTVRTP
ncbi:single-stranded DNA-binding protein [Kitasatospora sp. NPDC093806]|uniref:single-stranded DNA-binding protein n=1 Tax=Kitasatospora sp. NPDC093806 TaxID=3155075 RepID=UPI00344250CE